MHAFTTSGIVAGMLALQAVLDDRPKAAMVWLLATQMIDGIDGPMARAYDVKGRVPQIDGYVLDLVIDFVTCVVIPAAFLHQFNLLPVAPVRSLWSGLVVFTSALWFSRTDMMTPDHWFRGFPAVWNLVAPTLYLLGASPDRRCRRGRRARGRSARRTCRSRTRCGSCGGATSPCRSPWPGSP